MQLQNFENCGNVAVTFQHLQGTWFAQVRGTAALQPPFSRPPAVAMAAAAASLFCVPYYGAAPGFSLTRGHAQFFASQPNSVVGDISIDIASFSYAETGLVGLQNMASGSDSRIGSITVNALNSQPMPGIARGDGLIVWNLGSSSMGSGSIVGDFSFTLGNWVGEISMQGIGGTFGVNSTLGGVSIALPDSNITSLFLVCALACVCARVCVFVAET